MDLDKIVICATRFLISVYHEIGMKVARTVLSGGKDGDNFKVLPIATVGKEDYDVSILCRW
ncbi:MULTISPECIES: hypothetical protein [Bacillus cereus group]|uniref:hypothetical protein n=1 Tax=Bacillus cereus group TaxID=86661 RepID=UPI001F599921|nr:MULTISPECIES: hypothetical protein [unclassified Bacillus cereus group]